jgi:hypothetical protein
LDPGYGFPLDLSVETKVEGIDGREK